MVSLNELFPTIFPDPDRVGQSEYRAILEVVEDALAGAPEGEEVTIVLATLSEFEEWAGDLKNDVIEWSIRGLCGHDRKDFLEKHHSRYAYVLTSRL